MDDKLRNVKFTQLRYISHKMKARKRDFREGTKPNGEKWFTQSTQTNLNKITEL